MQQKIIPLDTRQSWCRFRSNP